MTDPRQLRRPPLPPPPLSDPLKPKNLAELYETLVSARFRYIDVTDVNGDGAAGILVDVETNDEDTIRVGLDYGYSYPLNIHSQVRLSEVTFDLVRSDAPEIFESLNAAARATAEAYLAAIEEVSSKRAESISMASARGAISGETNPSALGIHPQSAWGIQLAVIKGARTA
jgi:hypothetical protein